MLKHATINRTNRVEQTLQLQRQLQKRQQLAAIHGHTTTINDCEHSSLDANNNNILDDNESSYRTPSPQLLFSPRNHPQSPDGSNLSFTTASSSSRLPSLSSQPSTPIKQFKLSKSISNTSSPCKSLFGQSSSPSSKTNQQESIIKIFAQTLSQDVEYVTLHVNTQTKSQQIIKSLLKKFRLKHRDPNLFYLTFERWIRKDGLKCKSVMLLGDEACPMQLQQCCSNPPYNDIKFTLQMRAGALVKIHCSDVVPETRYKSLSLSAQTTVEETIELMLHCLNLVSNPFNSSQDPVRNSNSPSSTGSTDSSNSSSSGIDSDMQNNNDLSVKSATVRHHLDQLSANSRTSSIASISSNSNLSSLSINLTEQYCLIIECKDSNYKRVLESDEYLVDVYQNLLSEAKDQQDSIMLPVSNDKNNNNSQMSDQWFFIKLKSRTDFNNNPNTNIKFTNPRQNVPLPPIPTSIAKLNNATNLQHIVSTTQIEVSKKNHSRPPSSLDTKYFVDMFSPIKANTSQSTESYGANDLSIKSNSRMVNDFSDSAVSGARCPPPPKLIILPPIVPRRRNLSNASSTFVSPSLMNSRQSNPENTGKNVINKRRYDPAQLEADLSRLNMKMDNED